uniref:Uncharacterized protein n=1 Tax=Chionoecetes opilio bacilliform virus TaxID=1825681 RepID=A0A1Q3DLA2_9VIRU|nr:hypothetical protein [Chionoecetes opilio bacilliform virus]GAV93242.1 hypothetical protein SCV_122 [Chionoecetes opilio bacilliform virus]
MSATSSRRGMFPQLGELHLIGLYLLFLAIIATLVFRITYITHPILRKESSNGDDVKEVDAEEFDLTNPVFLPFPPRR